MTVQDILRQRTAWEQEHGVPATCGRVNPVGAESILGGGWLTMEGDQLMTIDGGVPNAFGVDWLADATVPAGEIRFA